MGDLDTCSYPPLFASELFMQCLATDSELQYCLSFQKAQTMYLHCSSLIWHYRDGHLFSSYVTSEEHSSCCFVLWCLYLLPIPWRVQEVSQVSHCNSCWWSELQPPCCCLPSVCIVLCYMVGLCERLSSVEWAALKGDVNGNIIFWWC